MSASKRTKRRKTSKGYMAENLLEPDKFPYRASWVDGLIHWIKRIPIPSWLIYVGLFAILTLLSQIGYLIDGYIPFGRYEFPLFYHIVAIYPVTVLAAIHYLDNTARRSFDDFRPALGKSNSEALRLQYELTTIPSRQAWVTAVVGAGFGVTVFLLGDFEPFAEKRPAAFGVLFLVSIIGFVMTAEMLYHTVRQLKMVSHIHSVASELNLMYFAPLYAFSRLSAQTGLFFMLVVYFDLVANSETLANPALLVLNVLVLPLIAAACFILPIEGMHRRLVREKRLLQRDVSQRIAASLKMLYERVDSSDLHDADAMNKTIASLVTTHELIAKLPTWPWRPETSALFFSALSLPVIVFLIQRVLENLLGS